MHLYDDNENAKLEVLKNSPSNFIILEGRTNQERQKN